MSDEMRLLDKAIVLATNKFAGKFDKGGTPYILHCLHVMRKVSHLGEDAMVVAVLHDIIEDTDVTLKDLVVDFPEKIVSTIVTLTHLPDESYENYIERIALNDLARMIKLEDLKHNSDITRMKGITKKDFDRLNKYHKSYQYLKKV